MSGEIKIHSSTVLQFFKYLIIGADSRTSDSSIKLRRIRSISEDVVYSMTSGRKKPSKHLKLGLVIKSLTGSKKVIEILNHYGHCASCTNIEELQTELTFSSYSENFITPPEMNRSPNFCTGLAFDNFDCFVETSTGKDTPHDTACIAYQRQREENANEVDQEYENQTAMEQVINKPVKRRRAFVSYGLDIESYYKKQKITSLVTVLLDNEKKKLSHHLFHLQSLRIHCGY